MRKSSSRSKYYSKILSSSVKSSSFQSLPRPKIRKLPALPGRTPNFLRVGCPTESLIHIPHSVAVLNKKSSSNLAVSSLSIKDLIDIDATQKIQKPKKPIEEVWGLFDSIVVPISTFAQIKVPSHWFSLDSNQHTDQEIFESNIRRRINRDNIFKLDSKKNANNKELAEIDIVELPIQSKSPYLQRPKYEMS